MSDTSVNEDDMPYIFYNLSQLDDYAFHYHATQVVYETQLQAAKKKNFDDIYARLCHSIVHIHQISKTKFKIKAVSKKNLQFTIFISKSRAYISRVFQ